MWSHKNMKKYYSMILIILFSITSTSSYSSDQWTVDVFKDSNKTVASVNGLKSHGDRLVVIFSKADNCQMGQVHTTIMATSNNPKILELKNKQVSANFINIEHNIILRSVKRIYDVATLTYLSLGMHKSENIQQFFKRQEVISLTLRDSDDFKITDYLDNQSLTNSWSSDGSSKAIDKAKQSCLMLEARGKKTSSRSKRNGLISSKEIIKKCWAVSKAGNRGNPDLQIVDTKNTVTCLENAIVENLVALYGSESRDNIKQRVQKFSTATGDLHYQINGELKDCAPSCGATYPGANMGVVAEFLGKILEHTINTRNNLN